MRALGLACLLCVVAGCSLHDSWIEAMTQGWAPDSGAPPRDAGGSRPDAGPDATLPAPDAGLDASQPLPDSGVDASQPLADSGVDASQPLADSGVDAAAVPLGCDERYGTVDGYLACPAVAVDRCSFYGLLGGRSCDDTCRDHGGECLEALYDAANDCSSGGPATCAEGHSDAICICTRP